MASYPAGRVGLPMKLLEEITFPVDTCLFLALSKPRILISYRPLLPNWFPTMICRLDCRGDEPDPYILIPSCALPPRSECSMRAVGELFSSMPKVPLFSN